MLIDEDEQVLAYLITYGIPPEHRMTLSIGTAVKRDAVIVKVTTASGPSQLTVGRQSIMVRRACPDRRRRASLPATIRP